MDPDELIALWEQSAVLRRALRDGSFWENEAWVNDFFDESKISDTISDDAASPNES